jgi:hypothetical protein
MHIPREPELAELVIADPPQRWRDLGFDVGDRLGAIKQAAQPGRWIATLRSDVGIATPLAFMSPEPP